MSELTGVDTQVEALDWFLNPEDKTPQLRELLARPATIGPTIVRLVNQLDSRAVHAYGVTDPRRPEPIKGRLLRAEGST